MDAAEYKWVIKGLSEGRKCKEWADNYLVHTLSPNVYRTLDESLHTFETFSIVGEWDVHFPDWERVLAVFLGAFVMWIIGKRLKKRHGLKEDVRESLYDATREWLMFVKKSGQGHDPAFAGGMKPNLADLSVYGVIWFNLIGKVAADDIDLWLCDRKPGFMKQVCHMIESSSEWDKKWIFVIIVVVVIISGVFGFIYFYFCVYKKELNLVRNPINPYNFDYNPFVEKKLQEIRRREVEGSEDVFHDCSEIPDASHIHLV